MNREIRQSDLFNRLLQLPLTHSLTLRTLLTLTPSLSLFLPLSPSLSLSLALPLSRYLTLTLFLSHSHSLGLRSHTRESPSRKLPRSRVEEGETHSLTKEAHEDSASVQRASIDDAGRCVVDDELGWLCVGRTQQGAVG